MSHKLLYFGLPGRGEVLQVMMALGDIPYENTIVDFPTWRSKPPATPWGTVPTLTLPDGFQAGQSRAILRYLAKQVTLDGQPLYPTDPKEALIVDEVADFIEDIWPVFVQQLLRVPDDQKAANAEKIMAPGSGQVPKMLDRLEKMIAGPFVLGSRKTMADIYIFAACGHWTCGFFPGVTADRVFTGRPKLMAIMNGVGALPKVQARYKKIDFSKKENGLWKAYTQFAKL